MTGIVLTNDYRKTPVARSVPGAVFDRESKSWMLSDPTPRAAAVCLRLFPELGNAHPELLELRKLLAQEMRPVDNASEYNKPIGASRLRAVLAAL